MNDWGRSDNDQRHRFVVSASVNTPMAPGDSMWEKIRNGFQASTMIQYYSALPFNIVSGVNSLQGPPAGRWRTVPRHSRTSTSEPWNSFPEMRAAAATSSPQDCA
jgi:hypothetical protein